jgi:hypothetical protein
MRFARWVFLLAGASGVLVVAPLYLEARFFAEHPPATNRPEFYYGFAGVTLAWQLLYLLIGTDPVRYRPAMLVASLAKASFALAVVVLFLQQRAEAWWLAAAAMDGTWVVLFAAAFLLTRKRPATRASPAGAAGERSGQEKQGTAG